MHGFLTTDVNADGFLSIMYVVLFDSGTSFDFTLGSSIFSSDEVDSLKDILSDIISRSGHLRISWLQCKMTIAQELLILLMMLIKSLFLLKFFNFQRIESKRY